METFTEGLIRTAEERDLHRFRSVVRIGEIEYRSPAVGLDVMVEHAENHWQTFAYIEGTGYDSGEWEMI